MLSLDKVLSVDTLDRKPSVIFLPGHLFFAKSVDLPQGMDPKELAAFVEISLEEHAPFPVNQVYYGAYHTEGSGRVLIFAAYRKRFTSGEKELWEDADLVLPDFVSVLGMPPNEPALYLLVQENTVSGVCFDGTDAVPVEVLSRHLDPETSAGERKAVVDEVAARLTSVHGRAPVKYFRRQGEVTRHKGQVYFAVSPATEEGEPDQTAGAKSPSVPRSVVSALDVRDKEFLAEKNKAATRDAWFWRSTVSLAALLLLLAIGELALYAAERILADRRALMEERAEQVATISEQLELAERMEELGANRLLPFEMLALLNEYRPSSISFRQTLTDGWNSLQVEAVTGNTGDVNAYENALRESGSFESVQVSNQRLSGGETTFSLYITFRSDVLRERSDVVAFPVRHGDRLVAAGEGGGER